MSNPAQSGAVRKSADTLHVLQACRGLACLMVVLYHGILLVGHWYEVRPIPGVYNFGYAGVHLFFVISGFIIYHAHYRDCDSPRNIGHYLLRRLVRIYPLYWLVFLVWGGWRVFVGRLDLHDFFGNALFFTAEKKLVVPVSWTLAHEMVFYCLFTVFVASRKAGYALFGGWFVLIVSNHLLGGPDWLPLRLANLLFVLGLLASIAAMALVKNAGRKTRDYLGWGGLITGVTLFAATAGYCDKLTGGAEAMDVWGNLLVTLGYGVASALILLSSVSARLEQSLKNRRFALLLGNASYSIYLVHFYIQRMAFNLTRPVDFIWLEKSPALSNLLLLFVMLVSVAAGLLVHKWVERPVLAAFRNLLKKA